MRGLIIYTLGAVCFAVLQALELNGFGWGFRMLVGIVFATLAMFIYERGKEQK
jgi:hypothetical protein